MICFIYFSLDYHDLMKGFYYSPSRKTLFIEIVFCFFFLFFFSFSINFFQFFSLILIFFLYSYHTFMTRPCSQTHIQGSWVWCCSEIQGSWAWLCSQTHLNLGHANLILLLILKILLFIL
jgi:hypothetical protein